MIIIIENPYMIKVKFENYEDIFYEFDYRPLNERELSDEVNSFILSQVVNLDNISTLNVILEIYLPISNYDNQKESKAIQGITNYYDSKLIFDNNISKLALKRLFYYFSISFLFLFLWYISQKLIGDKLITVMFDTAATVILWQAMTLIFIERKNYNINKKINKLFSEMNVIFKYI